VTDATQFWNRVKKGEGCWEWLASRTSNGYGQFCRPSIPYHAAHRIAWFLENGSIPVGLCVCHTCDNKGCVRPDHLFIGTTKDNFEDARSKGRWKPPQEQVAKLTIEQVKAIKAAVGQHQRSIDIAHQFGVSPQTICDIKKGRKWKNI
jgi:HNH endonuclease